MKLILTLTSTSFKQSHPIFLADSHSLPNQTIHEHEFKHISGPALCLKLLSGIRLQSLRNS